MIFIIITRRIIWILIDCIFLLHPGYLMLVGSPDREQRDLYEIQLRLVMRQASTQNGREVPVLFYTLYVNENVKETESKM